MSDRPPLRALLRRDHPGRTFGIFTALFGVGAACGLVASFLVGEEARPDCLGFAATFGLFSLVIGAVFARRLWLLHHLVVHGMIVEGSVLVVAQNTEDVWYLIVGYEVAGEKHRISQGTGDRSRFSPGDTVRLLVDPESPARAWIAET
ncbi:MAG: hypothetical protein C0483_07950 [Pirellula sp.]|nr:hypothetical protein [Pirellula sp.]